MTKSHSAYVLKQRSGSINMSSVVGVKCWMVNAAKSRCYWFLKSLALELSHGMHNCARIYRNGNDGQIKRRCGKGSEREFH
jgi:hypothetical protein